MRLIMVYLCFSLHFFWKCLISFPVNLIIHCWFTVIIIFHLLKVVHFGCHNLQVSISIQSFNKYLSRIYYGWSHVLSTWDIRKKTFALWAIEVYLKAQIFKQIYIKGAIGLILPVFFSSLTNCETVAKYLASISFNFLNYKNKLTTVSASWNHVVNSLSNPWKVPSNQ